MSALLESYAAGSWFQSKDAGDALLDAATGEEVARISSRGLDFAGMAEYARTVGGPAVRALTFRQRAALLKQVAAHLNENRDALYVLSTRTGATKRDSMVDIDGGIGTAFVYASKGAKELPDDVVLVDGGDEQLGKTGVFLGRHVYTSRPGVAVFPAVNRLNRLGKRERSFLAARASARLNRLCRSTPSTSRPGACWRSSVSFTGSAHTAGVLRSGTAVAGRGVRLQVEADSLNCSILGADVAPGNAEFDLFVKGVVTEMTVKAGQKCTAIRRVLVPEAAADAVVDAISAKLAKITVGNPANEDVRMGALASLAQRDEVRKAVEALRSSAEIVFGSADKVDLVDADAERGAFLSPVLLRARAGATEPHDVEPFGPVSTVLTYSSAEDAIALAARGKGSLVGSLITADPVIARQIVRGLAPWHGRILVLDSVAAPDNTGHGTPMPTLVHGGPGRAGGGEELGGLRGVVHHMQRSAVQGSPAMLEAITGP